MNAERIEQLRTFLEKKIDSYKLPVGAVSPGVEDRDDVLTIEDGHWVLRHSGDLKRESESRKRPYKDLLLLIDEHEKAEAELDAARPLLEAVEKATERDLRIEYFGDMTASSLSVLRAALSYREGKE